MSETARWRGGDRFATCDLTEERTMIEGKLGLRDKATLLASNLLVTAAIGFGTCMAVVYG